MKDKIPFHKITPLQSMMIDILDNGEKEVWNVIESYKNPFLRCKVRKLFAEAVKKINLSS